MERVNRGNKEELIKRGKEIFKDVNEAYEYTEDYELVSEAFADSAEFINMWFYDWGPENLTEEEEAKARGFAFIEDRLAYYLTIGKLSVYDNEDDDVFHLTMDNLYEALAIMEAEEGWALSNLLECNGDGEDFDTLIQNMVLGDVVFG